MNAGNDFLMQCQRTVKLDTMAQGFVHIYPVRELIQKLLQHFSSLVSIVVSTCIVLAKLIYNNFYIKSETPLEKKLKTLIILCE